MLWPQVIIGLLTLTMGRQLFWLFVAAAGFAWGMDVAPVLFPTLSPEALLLFAIAAGVIGAVFAYLLQWAAVAIAGFLVGGRLALLVIGGNDPTIGFSSIPLSIPFMIGGFVGAILMLMFFDWTLIVLSSIIGALLITAAISAVPNTRLLLQGALTVLGVIIQGTWLHRHATFRQRHPA